MSAEEMVQMQQTLIADAVKRQSSNHDRGIDYVGAYLRMWKTLEYDVKKMGLNLMCGACFKSLFALNKKKKIPAQWSFKSESLQIIITKE